MRIVISITLTTAVGVLGWMRGHERGVSEGAKYPNALVQQGYDCFTSAYWHGGEQKAGIVCRKDKHYIYVGEEK